MAQKKNKKTKQGFYLAISLIVIASLVAYFLYQRNIAPTVPSEAYITQLKNMVVSTQGELHVKMNVDIESPDEDSADILNENEWELRDHIMSMVEEMNDEDVSNPNVTDALKKKIKSYLDENYPGSEVVGVYFSDYITQ